MHWRTVFIILFLTFFYAVIGGVIFHFIETGNEQQMRDRARQKILDFLAERPCLNLSSVLALSKLLTKAKSAGLQAIPGSTNFTYITNWDLSSSIFLSFQVIGSVGYGNAPPKTVGGRIFCILFALFGIPLLVTSGLGLGYIMINGAERIRKCCIRHAGPRHSLLIHFVRTLIITVIVLTLLIFIPAAILSAVEKKWTYGDAIYFCFTTVLTIGFSDFIPGSDWSNDMRNLYRLGVGFWLIISLLIFTGLWSTISIAISSTREMQEPLAPEKDADLSTSPVSVAKIGNDNSIVYLPNSDKTPKIFADASPVTFRNSNPVLSLNGPLYNVRVGQGDVTHVAVH